MQIVIKSSFITLSFMNQDRTMTLFLKMSTVRSVFDLNDLTTFKGTHMCK